MVGRYTERKGTRGLHIYIGVYGIWEILPHLIQCVLVPRGGVDADEAVLKIDDLPQVPLPRLHHQELEEIVLRSKGGGEKDRSYSEWGE